MDQSEKLKIAIAVTGASGSVYAQNLFRKFETAATQLAEWSIVMTENAKIVWQTEIGDESYLGHSARYFSTKDFSAPFASGSAGYDALIVAPCSMGTIGRIASGISNDLITRAADVMLKERKKLICLVRETPYNLVHIRSMETITLAGGIICPATPSFYHKPQTIDELVSTVTDRVIDLVGLKQETQRWGNKKG